MKRVFLPRWVTEMRSHFRIRAVQLPASLVGILAKSTSRVLILTCPRSLLFPRQQSPLHNCHFRGNHISSLPHHFHRAGLTTDLSMTVCLVSETSAAPLVPRTQWAPALFFFTPLFENNSMVCESNKPHA